MTTAIVQTALSPVSDPAGWQPDEMASGQGWKYQLADSEVDALLSMAASVRVENGEDANGLLNLPLEAFDLGAFACGLREIYAGLRDGLGVALIRGLPLDDMDRLDAATIYWGIGRHLGTACPNNPEGDMLGHVTDLGKSQDDPTSRGYQTRQEMDYHCDQCDIVGLLCIRTANCGGISKIASSIAMYNALLAENPRYAEVLSLPLYWTKHGEHEPSDLPYYRSPVFNILGKKLCTAFGPKHILKGYRLPQTPEISSEQLAAIQRAEEIADALHFAMELRRGDMQFINNYVVLHTRTAFVDFDEPNKKRLLWRLWLMNDGFRKRTDYAKQWSRGVGPGNANARIRI